MLTTAAVAREPLQAFTIETVDVGVPRADEVLVRIVGVGLCHTDLVFRDQFAPYPLPAVLGHEGSGIIEQIGSGVVGLSVGDRVVLGFSSCGHCARCDEGLPSYCRDFPALNYAGARLDDNSKAYANGEEPISSHFFGQSSFAKHAVVRARNIVKVEDPDAPLEILGPLGCGFQTGAGGVMRAMACPEGSSIAIVGGGPVGLAAVMGAKIQRCKTIILVEPVAARRAMALDLGATHVVDPTAGDLTSALREITPDGVDFAFDSSGRIAAIQAVIGALAPRGLLGLVGVPPEAEDCVSINLAAMITFGQRVIGIMEGDSDPQTFIPELIKAHQDGDFPFDRLVTTFPLQDINLAIEAQKRGECVKVVLIP